MRLRHVKPRTWIALGVLCAGLGVGGYVAWQANQVRTDLMAARDHAVNLQHALETGDQAGAQRELAALTQRAAAAQDGTSGVMWDGLELLPVVGDDAEAVSMASAVLESLARDGLQPLVARADVLDVAALAPSDGQISLQTIVQMGEPLDASAGAFADARRRLDSLDASRYVGPVADAVDQLSSQVSGAARGMAAATEATRILPTMLGSEQPRTWLLIFPNPAELRSTGGLPAAAAIVRAENGKVEMGEQFSSADFPELAEPVLPLSDEEVSLYDDILGTYFVNASMTPSFDRTAALMSAHLSERRAIDVDGVMSIDPVALSYLLKATGPITVRDVELRHDNAVDELLNGVYRRWSDPAQQDVFFAESARVIFDRFIQGTAAPMELLKALDRGARERRLIARSFDDAEEAVLAETVVGADLLDERDGHPRIGIYLNDATGSKMSYYLDYQAEARATGCRDGRQKYAGSITLRSTAPGDAATSLPDYITGGGLYGVPAGEQLVIMHVYAPKGGSFDGIFIDGRNDDVFFEKHDGHTVASLALSFTPGEKRDVTFRMTSGEDMPLSTDLYMTPGVRSGHGATSIESLCGGGR